MSSTLVAKPMSMAFFSAPASVADVVSGRVDLVFATLIGAPSLGNPVYKALSNRNIPLGIEAGLAIVVLAIILDRMLAVRAGGKK